MTIRRSRDTTRPNARDANEMGRSKRRRERPGMATAKREREERNEK